MHAHALARLHHTSRPPAPPQVLPSATDHLVPHAMTVDDDLNAAALAARDEMRARHLQPEDLAAYAVAGVAQPCLCACSERGRRRGGEGSKGC